MVLDLAFMWNNKELFLNGLVITIELSVLTIVFGTIIGLFIAFGKRSQNYPIKKFCDIYTDFFRLLPVIIMLVWVFYVFPLVWGISIEAFQTGFLVLSLHLSAYVGELLRSGIEAIPTGQIEAAQSLGLSDFQINTRIILPQVFRQLLSPLTGLYIEEIKNTALVSIIALNELLHTGQILISFTYKPLEVYTSIAIIFILLTIPLPFISKKFEYATFIKKASVNNHEKHARS